MVIKINMKIIFLSILIAIFMYPKTLAFIVESGRKIYIAQRLNSYTIQSHEAEADTEKTKIVFLFDDGWKSVYTEVYELMKELNYQASIGVIPSLVDEKEYMSYEELAKLYVQGWDLLNHSYSHKENMYENSDELLSDFEKARQWMNNRYIGKCSDMAVIPYGEINPFLIGELKEAGYRNFRTSDNIIILNKDEPEYYPSTTINLLTKVTVTKVKNLLEESFDEPKTVIFILHKIGDKDDGFGLTYSKYKFEEIIKFINQNNNKLQVITYSQLFE